MRCNDDCSDTAIDGESKNKTKLKNESNGFFENGLKRITVAVQYIKLTM